MTVNFSAISGYYFEEFVSYIFGKILLFRQFCSTLCLLYYFKSVSDWWLISSVFGHLTFLSNTV